MIIYKYMSYHRFLKSITPDGVYLKISRPCEFNDPFDCAGRAIGCPTKELLAEIRTKHVPVLEMFSKDCIHNALSLMLSMRHTFDAAYRVFSASDALIVGSAAEMLMWSHYGDSSKGVRVAIEIDAIKAKCKRVRYKKLLPCLDLSMVKSLDPFCDDTVRKFLVECLFTKNFVWKHEKERRIVFRIDSPEIKRWTLHDVEAKVEQAMFVWTPPKTAIRQVCIGSEIDHSKQNLEGVKDMVRNLNASGYNIESKLSVRGGRYCYGECKL